MVQQSAQIAITEGWVNTGSLLAQLTASYEKSIGNHFGKLLVGTSQEDMKNRTLTLTRKSFVTNDLELY